MDNFEAAVNQLIESGNFIEFTSGYELTTPATSKMQLDGFTAEILDTGVLLFEPDNATDSEKDLLISSGIHGNETAPIEIVNQLVGEIFQGKTQVKNRTLFIIGNPASMNLSQRFVEENLNRLFCGKFKNFLGAYESKRAKNLEQYVTDFFQASANTEPNRFHYDLHTAMRASKYKRFVVYPYRGEKPWDKQQLEFFHASGVSTVLLGHAASGTFSYYTSSTFNAHAFTVELGKVKPFGENDMSEFQAITDNLRHLIQGERVPTEPFKVEQFKLFRVLHDLTKQTDDFKLHITDDMENFTSLPVGFLLSEDGDNRYITQQEGESLIFPNPKVKKGQRAGLIVVPTEL